MGGGRAPDWVGDTLRLAVEDGRAYLRTAIAFSVAPYRTARGWVSGDVIAMNPIGVLAAAAVVLGPVRQLAYQVLSIPHADGLLPMLASALGPFVHYAVLGALAHVVLAPGDPDRPQLGESVAISLFVGGGPAAFAELAAWMATLILRLVVPGADLRIMLGISLGVAFSVFCSALGFGLAGLHRKPWWRMLLAFVFAFSATGLVFGTLDPPGEYGMHWLLSLDPFWLRLGW